MKIIKFTINDDDRDFLYNFMFECYNIKKARYQYNSVFISMLFQHKSVKLWTGFIKIFTIKQQ